jgi:hypothetical protein
MWLAIDVATGRQLGKVRDLRDGRRIWSSNNVRFVWIGSLT